MRPENNDNGKSNRPQIVVNRNMKSHGNDPFFAKKAEASKKTIEKYGLPKQLNITGKCSGVSVEKFGESSVIGWVKSRVFIWAMMP